MKQTMLLGAALLLPLTLSAHPHKGSLPQGEVLTVAVATGSGKHTYKNVPWWGMAESRGVGSTNGGVAIDKTGKIYFSTDTVKVRGS